MPANSPKKVTAKVLLAASMVFSPAVIFYGILALHLRNLPLFDDYDALLGYLNVQTQLHGVSAKAAYFFSAQYNEYKLFFEHMVVWLEAGSQGHLDFRLLCMLGNCFVLLLGIQLWAIFLPGKTDLGTRLTLFIPVSWLLFQLEYVETLDWAMGSLQNLPVIIFSFGAIMLLLKPGWRSYLGAIICMILAVGSSGNGFVVIAVGLLLLGLSRRYLQIIGWLFASTATLIAYAYRYNVLSSQSPKSRSVFSTLKHMRVDYILAFLGSAAGHPGHGAPFVRSFILGMVLCIVFALFWWKGYYSKRPVVGYCALFLFVTAVGVAGLRSDFGLIQSLSSRYAIYSNLLLIFVWFAIAEEFLLHRSTSVPAKRILFVAIGASVLFGLAMDALGWRSLARRDIYLVQGMTAYEHRSPSHPNSGPLLPLPKQDKRADEMDQKAAPVLQRSEALDIYRPPTY